MLYHRNNRLVWIVHRRRYLITSMEREVKVIVSEDIYIESQRQTVLEKTLIDAKYIVINVQPCP